MDSRERLLTMLFELEDGLSERIHSIRVEGGQKPEVDVEVERFKQLLDSTATVRSRLQSKALGSPEHYGQAQSGVAEALGRLQANASLEQLTHAVDRALYFSDPTTSAND